MVREDAHLVPGECGNALQERYPRTQPSVSLNELPEGLRYGEDDVHAAPPLCSLAGNDPVQSHRFRGGRIDHNDGAPAGPRKEQYSNKCRGPDQDVKRRARVQPKCVHGRPLEVPGNGLVRNP